MLDRLRRGAVFAAFVLAAGLAHSGAARAEVTWEGVALIEQTSGTQCGPADLGVGKFLRVFFKPRTVGGNSTGSELLFIYERGAFQMRRSGADFSGAGTYDGDAVSFTLHNADAFTFGFHRSTSGKTFDLSVHPQTILDTTANVRLSGAINSFFILNVSAVSQCEVVITANLFKQP